MNSTHNHSRETTRDDTLRFRQIFRSERRLDEKNRAKLFGTKLSAAIKQSGLSMREVEKRTLIDSATLYNYTRGITSPKLYNVMILAKVLKTHIWDLYPL